MSKQIVELINKYQTSDSCWDLEFIDNVGILIRCKDCDHCLDYGDCHVCNIAQIVINVEPDDYCSRAERKRDE